MKDYKEVAESVLRRSEEIITNNRRKKRAMIKTGSLTASFCFAALLGLGAWQSGVFWREKVRPAEQFAEAGDHGGESDVVLDNGNSDFDGDPDGYSPAYNYEEMDNSAEISEQLPAASAAEESLSGLGGMIYIPDIPENGDAESIWESFDMKTMISSYGDGSSSASYRTPENGTFGFSIPLRGAMDEYGDDVLYRVCVDVFSDREMLSPDSTSVEQERGRLAGLGYTVAFETYYDGTVNHHYFTLHATIDQLTDFAASGEYGYMFFLYDECVTE